MLKALKHMMVLANKFRGLDARISRLQEAVARIESRQLSECTSKTPSDHEFRCFSQWGEDGIIQYLVNHLDLSEPYFVEFGVEDYKEANTRFLLVNNNWRGLVIDGSPKNVENIRRSGLCWAHDLTALCNFVTDENIDDLLRKASVPSQIGLLSIDVDGQDLWIFQNITATKADILVMEYNHRFGATRRITVPRDPNFYRTNAHHSNIYYGASLAALERAAERKGYRLVGCNTAGNNAFFVRQELLNEHVLPTTAAKAFRSGYFHESRGRDGALTYLTAQQEHEILKDLPYVEIE